MKTKKCVKCKQDKSITLFNKKGKYLHSKCKTCSRVIGKTYYERNKKHYIGKVRDRQRTNIARFYTLKALLKCTLCTEKEICCLDFHHLDARKKDLNISSAMRTHSWKKTLSEMVKCVVVCVNCHRKIHAKLLKVSKKHLFTLPKEFLYD